MIELKCYDGYGNTIDSIAQWSIGQVIYIQNMNFSSAPVALLCKILKRRKGYEENIY